MAIFYEGGLFSFAPGITLGDHTCRNIMWLKGDITGPLIASDLQTLANNLYTAWANTFRFLYPSTITFLPATVTDFSSSSGLSTVSAATPISGSGTGVVLPAQVAILVNAQVTSERYRGGHSRLYIPAGVVGDIVDPQNVESGHVSTINSGMAGWITFLASVSPISGGLRPVVLHQRRKVSRGSTSFIPAYHSFITGYKCSPRLATQRRRVRRMTRS